MVETDIYPSDQTMAELFNDGSLKAFTTYNIYAPALFGSILRIAGEQTAAENILQQTFIELWNNKQTYKPFKERIFTWMFKTARKLALKSIRTSAGADENSYMYNLVYSKETEDYLTGKNTTACIEAGTKQALHLMFFKTYTIDAVANELNIAKNELCTKLKLAIEQLNSVAI